MLRDEWHILQNKMGILAQNSDEECNPKCNGGSWRDCSQEFLLTAWRSPLERKCRVERLRYICWSELLSELPVVKQQRNMHGKRNFKITNQGEKTNKAKTKTKKQTKKKLKTSQGIANKCREILVPEQLKSEERSTKLGQISLWGCSCCHHCHAGSGTAGHLDSGQRV